MAQKGPFLTLFRAVKSQFADGGTISFAHFQSTLICKLTLLALKNYHQTPKVVVTFSSMHPIDSKFLIYFSDFSPTVNAYKLRHELSCILIVIDHIGEIRGIGTKIIGINIQRIHILVMYPTPRLPSTKETRLHKFDDRPGIMDPSYEYVGPYNAFLHKGFDISWPPAKAQKPSIAAYHVLREFRNINERLLIKTRIRYELLNLQKLFIIHIILSGKLRRPCRPS